jgi:hypothetical protein
MSGSPRLGRLREPPLACPAPSYLSTNSFGEVLGYGVKLSEAYIALADRAQDGQIVASFGIIAAAIAGTAGLVFGANTSVALAAALTGGSIFAIDRYLRPGEATESLLASAEAMLCIVRAGQEAQPDNTWPEPWNGRRIDVVATGYSTVRTNLRQRLQRKTPNFGSLARELAAATLAARDTVAGLTGEEAAAPVYEAIIAELRAEITS